MATPKTITQLTERSGDLALTDEIEVQVSGATSTVKKALSYIKKLVIGTATIGGAQQPIFLRWQVLERLRIRDTPIRKSTLLRICISLGML